MSDNITYLTPEQTGLPFTVQKNGMNNFRAIFGSSMIAPLTISDIINIHLLVELKTQTQKQ